MTVRLYQSTDASAPSLTGQVGSLTSLLDAILVNGYGSKTAAGWTIAYTATNKRQYAMASGGTGRQLYIDDTAPSTAKEARATGWVGGSALNTGTRQFPTTSQMTAPSGAVVSRKSTSADSTARAWNAVADGHTLYLWVYTGDFTTPAAAMFFSFGDFFSDNASDTSNCQILGRTGDNQSSFQYEWLPEVAAINIGASVSPLTTFCPSGHYADAQMTNVGGSVQLGHILEHGLISNTGANNNGGTLTNTNSGVTVAGNGRMKVGHYWFDGYSLPYPNPADGSCLMVPYRLCNSSALRGRMKGLWIPLHDRPFSDGDTFTSSSGLLNGKSFIAANIGCWGFNNANDYAQVLVEYSDTWS